MKEGSDSNYINDKIAPKTPPSSQRASRGGKGVKTHSSSEVGLSLLDDYEEASTPSCSSPLAKKRKRNNDSVTSTPSKSSGSPTKGKGLKWEQWEDDILRQEIISVGEKGADWHRLLKEINEKRSMEEPRSIHSIKFHWSHQLKVKMLHQS